MEGLATKPPDRPVHDVRPQRVLDSLHDLRTFVEKAVLKDQCESHLTRDLGSFKTGGTARIPSVEVDHEREQTHFAVLPPKWRIGVPCKALTGSIAIQAKALVEADRLAAVHDRRNSFAGAPPEILREIIIVKDAAIVASGVGCDSRACCGDDGCRFEAVCFRPLHERLALRWLEQLLDGEYALSDLSVTHGG